MMPRSDKRRSDQEGGDAVVPAHKRSKVQVIVKT